MFESGIRRALAAAVITSALLTTAAKADSTPFGGFYLGLHGGAAFVDTSGIYDSVGGPGPFNLSNLDLDDAVVGGQVGYNYQTGILVVGAEADLSALMGNDQLAGEFQAPVHYEFVTKVNRLWSIRGKVGVTAGNFLFFGTAGYGELQSEVGTTPDQFFPAPPGRVTFNSSGAVYGGGIEYSFGPGLFRIEYLHYDVGFNHVFAADSPNIDRDLGDNVSFDDIDVVRAALSYRLN